LLGGGTLSLDGAFGAGADLYDYISSNGGGFKSPLEAGLAAINLVRNLDSLTTEGLREQGYNIIENAIGEAAGIDVSGVANTVIPQNNGTGGNNQTTEAVINSAPDEFVFNYSQTEQLRNNPEQREAAAKELYKKDFLNDGSLGGINEFTNSWSSLPEATKQFYRDKAVGDA